VGKTASWKNGNLTKWQVGKIASWKNGKSTKFQVDKKQVDESTRRRNDPAPILSAKRVISIPSPNSTLSKTRTLALRKSNFTFLSGRA
jgi:hypothetical protein